MQLTWANSTIVTDFGTTPLAKKVFIIDNPSTMLYQSTNLQKGDTLFSTTYSSGWFTYKMLGFPEFNTVTIDLIIAGAMQINICQIIFYIDNFYVATMPTPMLTPYDTTTCTVNVGWKVATYDDFMKALKLLQKDVIEGTYGTLEYFSLCHAWRCLNNKLLAEACDDNCGEFCRLKDYEKIHHKILASSVAFNNHQFANAQKLINQVEELCGTTKDCGC
jgi:hypothetical protein